MTAEITISEYQQNVNELWDALMALEMELVEQLEASLSWLYSGLQATLAIDNNALSWETKSELKSRTGTDTVKWWLVGYGISGCKVNYYLQMILI